MKQLVIFLFILCSKLSFGQDSLWVKKADSIVMFAQAQLGVPYKWATSNPDVSFDCSGFTSYVYASNNLPHSRSSKAYGKLGEKVELENCRKGDCIIFTGTAGSGSGIGHVGIVVSNDADGLKFIHCSSSKKHFGVVITDYYNSGYPKRFHSIRRMIP
jgi:cell wall-associated NlpC family hydrolase